MIFILGYFLSGTLPWNDSTKEEIEKELERRTDLASQPNTPILQKKFLFLEELELPTTKNEIKKAFYDEFRTLAEYIINLEPRAEPDYRWILHRCDRLLLLAGTRKDRCFDWCPPECPKRRHEELWDIFK